MRTMARCYLRVSLLKKAAAIYAAAAFLVQMILLLGVHGALPAILAQTLKLDGAVNLGEQGVVLTDAHIDTGMDVGASLANQNVAGQNELTVGTLHAQTLGLGITAVLGGTAALVVSEELNTNLQQGVTPPKLRYYQDSRPAANTESPAFRQALPERCPPRRRTRGESG